MNVDLVALILVGVMVGAPSVAVLVLHLRDRARNKRHVSFGKVARPKPTPLPLPDPVKSKPGAVAAANKPRRAPPYPPDEEEQS